MELAGTVELPPNGYHQQVTESNKADYLRRLVDHVLTPTSMTGQAKFAWEGFLRVLCPGMVDSDVFTWKSVPGSDER